jgi:putative transcriptional regulator
MADSLRGQLLIASPTLLDPNFRRTVVLVTAHTDEGAMGLVLNRPTPASVHEAVPHLEHLVGDDEYVYLGGPVEISAVTALAELEGIEPAVEVFERVGFLPAELDDETARATRRARVFAGYAGWAEGQLEAELEESAWIVEPARADDVFSADPDALWSDVLGRKGGEYRLLALMPEDPSLN